MKKYDIYILVNRWMKGIKKKKDVVPTETDVAWERKTGRVKERERDRERIDGEVRTTIT